MFLSGLVEIPAVLFVVFVNNRWGRRYTLAFLMLIGGASCITVMFAVLVRPDLIAVTTALAMIGRAGITGGWATAQIFAAEVFPTVIRNIGIATCSMSARIGGIVAPQIVFLDAVSMSLPYVVFGGLGLVCGLLAFALPETKNEPLPENLPARDICMCLGSSRGEESRPKIYTKNTDKTIANESSVDLLPSKAAEIDTSHNGDVMKTEEV